MKQRYIIFFCIINAAFHNVSGFTLPISQSKIKIGAIRAFSPSSSFYPSSGSDGPKIGFENSCVLTDKQISPIIRLNNGVDKKQKIANAFGLWSLIVALTTAPFWRAAMWLVNLSYKINPRYDPNRSIFDRTGKIWSKTWLKLTNSYPTISGDVERLKDKGVNEPCLFVANHASWMDIPVLCTVLDPVFKFIAKEDLKALPCIGEQLKGGNHILIDREDRRSQFRTFKEGIAWLKKGVPLMAFPEGQRSADGKLLNFKGGVFAMAIRSNVPIVPISVSNTHAIFPADALFPVQSGNGKLHVHVHEAINPEGKEEEQLTEMVRSALLSKMPLDQHPI